MSTRPKIPSKTELNVIHFCARRCCMCYSLVADFEEKKGQIAHLDHNRENNKIDNLAWLCLEHHDKYDSKTSQSKGYSIKEVKKYRSILHSKVEQWRDCSNQDKENSKTIKKFLDDNISLVFFAGFATVNPLLRRRILKEIDEPVLKEKLFDVWAFLDSPDTKANTKLTNLDLMVDDISKTGDAGTKDLQTLLGLATEALFRMPENKRIEALLKIKGNKIREGLMVLQKIGLNMMQESQNTNASLAIKDSDTPTSMD